MNRSLIPPPALLILLIGTAWFATSQKYPKRLQISEYGSVAQGTANPEYFELVPLGTDLNVSAIADRSVFQPQRRPWLPQIQENFVEAEVFEEEFFDETKVVAEEAPRLAPPPSFRLLGATNESGDARALLALDEYSQDERWVSLGEELAGWTVVEILPQGIRLVSGSEDILIEMYR